MTANAAQPLFIMCAARSGSTLLRYVMDTHPQVYAPPELHLGRLCADLVWAYTYSTALEAPADITAQALRRAGRDISRMMQAATAAHGKQVWCEKSVSSLAHADLLQSVFPDARYVCLYRHAGDMVHSGLRAQQRQGGGFGFEPYITRANGHELNALADYWCEQTLLLARLQQAVGERAVAVRYEALVSTPAPTVASLLRALSLPAAPGLIEQVFSTAHAPGPGDAKITQTDRVLDRRGGGRALDWSTLADDRRARIDRICKRLAYPTLAQYLQSDVSRSAR